MTLIHITDLHFWEIVCNPCALLNKRFIGNLNLIMRRRRHLHTNRAQSFIELLCRLHPDALLVGGDVSTTATAEEFRQAAAFLKPIHDAGIPIYLLPGNHDYYTFESRRAGRFERFLGQYTSTPDEVALTRLPNGLPLVLVPTVRPNWFTSRGAITVSAARNVRNSLENLSRELTVVLGHYPCLETTTAYASGFGRRLVNAEVLRRALGEGGHEVLYLAGHVHVFSHTRDSRYPSVTHMTSSALFYEKKDRPAGFTEIVVGEQSRFQIFPWQYTDRWMRGEESKGQDTRQ